MSVQITPIVNASIDNEPTPLPTVGELVRYIARALDIKYTNKKLDAFAQDVDFNWLKEGEVIDDGIFEKLKIYVDVPFAEWFMPHVKKLLENFKNLILKTNVDVLKRDVVLQLLINEYFVAKIIVILKDAEDKFDFPYMQFLVNQNKTAFSVVIKSFSQEQDFVKIVGHAYADDFSHSLGGSYSRMNRLEQFRDWLCGKNILDLSSLKLLANTIAKKSSKNIAKIVSCLIIARALDWLFAEMYKHNFTLNLTQHVMLGDSLDIKPSLEKLNSEKSLVTENIKLALEALFQKFHHYKNPKLAGDLECFRNGLIEAQSTVFNAANLSCGQYLLDLFYARFYVMQGQPEIALKFYESSFKRSLYRAGKIQKDILMELLATAAYLEDKPCLKKHKAWALAFNIYPKNKFSKDVIEYWEIKELKKYFYELFPRECLFSEAGDCYQHPDGVLGMEIIFTPFLDNRSLNLRSPNKKIPFVGKLVQQLIAEVSSGNLDNIKDLLERGADVNKIDIKSGGSSALLNALQKANDPFSKHDVACVVELLKYPHTKATLNRLTDRKRLSILFEAIQLGKPDIVEIILEMGADSNLRAQIENHSPLDLCIQLLYSLGLENALDIIEKHPNSVKYDDLARITGRFGSEMFGAGQQQVDLEKLMAKKPEIMKVASQLLDKDFRQKHTEKSLYEIAQLLLSHGANPNSGNPKNYGVTPLMYAAEVRHQAMFELLIKYKGDVRQSNSEGKCALDYINHVVTKAD
ncbi:MAG: ankyrin repeat domain-containing protein [Methylotenera sp.]|nr:ankyrin repeat domain-containing protein [Methylotenera sp.]